MPGFVNFRPIEANLKHDTELLAKMSPYCSFTVADKHFNTEVCQKGGKHPAWTEIISVPASNDNVVSLDLMDKNLILSDDIIGSCALNLKDIAAKGSYNQSWYPLYYKNKPAGEILLEADFEGGNWGKANLDSMQKDVSYQDKNLFADQNISLNQSEFVNRNLRASFEKGPSKVFSEQHESVEARKFVKNVEITETIPVQKEIEVMESRKVMKDVEYTEAVPVSKEIEIVEPVVVTKEIEVLVPRVVTKTIEVIENVPVIMKVDVVEMRHHTKTVETMEPRTCHKQMEVTEQYLVRKMVTVSEPVTKTKQVEFIEPIITTQIITKELKPDVVVSERTIRSVGPASLISASLQKLNTSQKVMSGKQEQQFIGDQKLIAGQQQKLIGDQRLLSGKQEEQIFGDQKLSYSQQFVNGEQKALSGQQLLTEDQKFASEQQQKLSGDKKAGSSSFTKEERLLRDRNLAKDKRSF